MQYKIFSIPLYGDKAQEDELNLFLRSHRIAAVDKHFSENASAWCFCVTYIESTTPSGFSPQTRKEKVDYKEILDEPTFARFSRLREARKQIAADEAIPAYSVFTNEELAAIAAKEELTVGSIVGIQGIGDKRTEKYGHRLIELYNTMPGT